MLSKRYGAVRRVVTSISVATLVGALIAGCSGGSGTAIPKTPNTVKNNPPKVLSISKATIPEVMAKFIRGGAYYSPMKGQPIKKIPGIRTTLTAAAGNDLSFYGGPVSTGLQEYNILVNCADESCWGGSIGRFENDLSNSNMIHIIDQYTNANSAGAYTDGGDYAVSYNTSGTLQDQDIYNIIHQVATTYGLATGYGSMFNVFLGSGVQQCSTAAGGCYAVQYCAYHGSNDFSDIGHTLYSVEPYQNINGCQVSYQPSPNGVEADSTSSTLSHETFETITDPDVGINNVAWYNSYYGEIGDLCAPANSVPTGNVTLGADTWEIQSEYDNNVHDCSYSL